MKLAVEGNKATVSGGGETGQFKIAASQKAFQILSSGLYSDKILAIVRELSCNAYDAQVEAGNADRPFDVQLPTGLSPEFIIRDYGIGLDHEGVMNVYTTYFESTKQDSNEYIGALGLGSKSPFSYTENFTVTAIKNGVKRVYAALIEEGFPSIVKFGDDVKTTEEDGVEVKFAVKKQDFHKFSEAALKVYRWFDVTPNILGNQVKIKRAVIKHKQIIPGVDIREQDGYSDRGPLARQGNVTYPLRPNEEDLDKDLRSLLDAPYVIDFPIGSLDVAASREELSYIKLTNDSINARLREVKEGMADYVERELNAAKTDWEVMEALNKMSDNTFSTIIKGLVADEKRKLVSKDVLIEYQYNACYIDVTDKQEKAGNYEIGAYAVRTRNHSTGAVRLSRQQKSARMTGSGNQRVLKHNSYTIRVSDRNLFFLNDTGKRNALGRVREYLSTNGSRHATVYVVNVDDDKAVKAFKKSLGNPPADRFVLCSSLPEPARYKANAGATTRINMLVVDYNSSRNRYDGSVWFWKEEKSTLVDFADGEETLYVPLKNRTVLKPDGTEMSKDAFFNMIEALHDSGLIKKSTKIAGVRKSVINDLTKDYVNLFDWVKKQLAQVSKKRIQANFRSLAAVENSALGVDILKKVAADLDDSHDLSKMLERFTNADGKTVLENPKNLQRLNRIASYVNDDFDIDTDKLLDQGKAEWQKISHKYPLIDFVRGGYGVNTNAMSEALVDYIVMVDKVA